MGISVFVKAASTNSISFDRFKFPADKGKNSTAFEKRRTETRKVFSDIQKSEDKRYESGSDNIKA
jgi:hypothetical protein